MDSSTRRQFLVLGLTFTSFLFSWRINCTFLAKAWQWKRQSKFPALLISIGCLLLSYPVLSPSSVLLSQLFQHPREGAGIICSFHRRCSSDMCMTWFAQRYTAKKFQNMLKPGRLTVCRAFNHSASLSPGHGCERTLWLTLNKEAFIVRVHLTLLSSQLGWIMHKFTWLWLSSLKPGPY